MPNNNPYIIIGQFVDDESTYWQRGYGWTISKEHATHYTADILTKTLPTGVSCVINMNDNPITLLGTVGGEGGMQIFEKII